MGYEESVRNHEHEYGEYIKQINFLEAARNNIDDQRIYEKTLELLKEDYEDKLKGGRKRRRCKQKAKQVVNPRLSGPYNFVKKFRGRKGTERLLKEAVEKGYLKKIKLSVPWHPEVFSDEDKLTTFPHQHKYAVLYTGRKEFEIYSKEYCKEIKAWENVGGSAEPEGIDELINAKSFLKTGYISPANSWVESEEEKIDEGEWTIHLTADIWKAKSKYAAPLLLEVECPTSLLEFDDSNVSKLVDWFKIYESPIKLRESGITEGKEIFYTKEGDKYPKFPVNFVNGISDKKGDLTPGGFDHFYPVKGYAELLKEEYPERIPDKPWRLRREDSRDIEYSFRRRNEVRKESIRKWGNKVKILRTRIQNDYMVSRLHSPIRNIESMEDEIEWLHEHRDSAKFEEYEHELERLGKGFASHNEIIKTLVNLFLKRIEFNGNPLVKDMPDKKPFEELFSENYFKKIDKEIIETNNQLETKIQTLYELAQKGEEEKCRQTYKQIINLLRELYNDLYLVELDEESLKDLLQYLGLQEKDKIHKGSELVYEAFKTEIES